MDIILQSLSAGVALLLAFLTLTNVNGVNQKANFWLGIFLVCVFLLFLDDVFVGQNTYLHYPHLFGFVPILALLLTPTLYLSVLHFVNPQGKWKWSNLLHFLLLILYLMVALPFYFSSATIKLKSYQADTFMNHAVFGILLPLFFLQALIYGIKMLRKLSHHHQNTLLYSAETTTIQLGWLRNFIMAFLVMMFFWSIKSIYPVFLIEELFDVVLFISIFLLAHFSLRQKEVFSKNEVERANIAELLSEKETLEKKDTPPLVTPSESISLNEALNELMITQKPYLDNELNLPKLATYLAIPAYKLSYLLNNHIGENFSMFINNYRVEVAKEILADPKKSHLTLLQVAYEAGYNSKTVFNTHFKKVTGIVPSAYRKEFKSK